MNRLHALLKEIKPAIRTPWLNGAAKLPRNTLNKHYARGQFTCHVKHAPAIVRVLSQKFGVCMVGDYRVRFSSPFFWAINYERSETFAMGDAELVEWMLEDIDSPAKATK